MSFVISPIGLTDRVEHQLDAFDAQQPFSSPQRSWVIDRSRRVFLRMLRLDARKNEPGDADSLREVYYHLRWGSDDFVIATRYVQGALEELDGEIFEPHSAGAGMRTYGFYVWYVSPLTTSRTRPLTQVLLMFCEAMSASCGGAFHYASKAQLQQPRRTVLKLSPDVERNYA